MAKHSHFDAGKLNIDLNFSSANTLDSDIPKTT